MTDITPITLITDCGDPNAEGRQRVECQLATGLPLTAFIHARRDIAAAGEVATIVAQLRGRPGVVVVNAAPRNGSAREYPNGSPFGYLWYEETLIVGTVACQGLSLLPHFGFGDVVNVVDIPMVAPQIFTGNPEVAQSVLTTQFRSLEFVPHLVAYLLRHSRIRSKAQRITPAAEGVYAWCVDNFGNVKLTLTEDAFTGDAVTINGQQISRYDGLRLIPDGELGICPGSCGPYGRRFLELIINGGNAAEKLGLKTGDQLHFE